MKRIISAVLSAMLLMLCICGCGTKDKADTSSVIKHSVNVAKIAKTGRIPEVDFVLGDPVDGVKDVLFEKSAGMTYEEYCNKIKASGNTPSDDEYGAYVISSLNSGHTILSANYDNYNSVYCMYTTENESGGIAAIAVVGDAYGFNGNTMLNTVKASIAEKGTVAAADSTLGFLPKGDDGAVCLTYDFGLYKLEFYFSSYNTLVATVLYNTQLW